MFAAVINLVFEQSKQECLIEIKERLDISCREHTHTHTHRLPKLDWKQVSGGAFGRSKDPRMKESCRDRQTDR